MIFTMAVANKRKTEKQGDCHPFITNKTFWGQFLQRSTSSLFEHRSQKGKKPNDLTVFFALSESARVKAARRTLMKLTPDSFYNFTN